VFLINGVSFMATIGALLAMRTAQLHGAHRVPRSRGQIREVVAYLRGRSDLVMIMVVMAVVSMFALNFQVTSALMAKVAFGKDADAYGILGSVFAIGSLGGALLAARRKTPRVRLMLGAGLIMAASLALMGSMRTIEAFAIASIPCAFASMTMMTSANTTIQTTVDPAIRGRVMALYMMVFQGATPIGSPIIGWIGEENVLGPRWSIGVGAIATFAVVAAATWWAVRNWNLRLRPHLHPHPHIEVVTLPGDPAAGLAR
jgi:predicted MFS family arabinose efflux permease